jgi:hypothetical protein
MLTGFLSSLKAVTFSDKGSLLLVGMLSHQAIRYLLKELWLRGCLGIEHRSVGIALAEGLHDLGGISFTEGFHDWELASRAPYKFYPGICRITEEKHGDPQSGWPSSVRSYSLCRLGRLLRGCLNWPADRHPSLVNRGRLQTALGRHKCLPSC